MKPNSEKKPFPGYRLASSYPFNNNRYETMHDLVTAFADDAKSWELAKMHLKRGNVNTWLQKIDEFDLDVQIYGILRTYQDPDLQLCLLIAKFSTNFKFYYKSQIIDLRHLIRIYQKYQKKQCDPLEGGVCRAFLNGTLKKWYDNISEIRGGSGDIYLEMGLAFPGQIREADLSPAQAENTIILYLSSLLDASSCESEEQGIEAYLSNRLGEFIDGKKFQEGLVLIDTFERILDNSDALLTVKEKTKTIYKKRIRQEQQDAILEEGFTYLNEDKIDDAIRIIDIAIGIEEGYAKAWFYKASALAGLFLFDEALMAYNRAIELEPNNSITWIKRGNTLCKLGKYKEAVDSYHKAIEINPDYSGILCNVGFALCNHGVYIEALKALNIGLKQIPEDVRAWCHKGIALYHLGEYEATVESFNQVRRLDPGFIFPWIKMADALFQVHRYEEALKWTEYHLQNDRDNKEVWNRKGELNYLLQRYPDALDAYTRALELDETYVEARINKGISLFKLGFFQKAIEMYDCVLEINSMNAEAWFFKGEAFFQLGRTEDALMSYGQSIGINPENARAWNNKGDVLVDLRMYEEAIQSYRKSITLDPTSAISWKNLGIVLCKIGKNDEGEAAFNEAFEREPELFRYRSRETLVNLKRHHVF